MNKMTRVSTNLSKGGKKTNDITTNSQIRI